MVKGEMRGVGSSTGAKEKHAHPGEPVLTHLHSMTSSPGESEREQVSIGLDHTLYPRLNTSSMVHTVYSMGKTAEHQGVWEVFVLLGHVTGKM